MVATCKLSYEAGSGSSRPGASSRLFSTLIGLETGFAFLLLVGSGFMIRSLVRVEQEDHGFRPDHVLTLRVPVRTLTQPRPTGKYDTKPRQVKRRMLCAQHTRRLSAVPIPV